MTALIKKLYASDVVRYVFFGGCTTLVNLVSFFLLRQAGVQRDLANVISIILAILFAYVVNSKFVFQDKMRDFERPYPSILQICRSERCNNGDRSSRRMVLCRNHTHE